MIQMTPATVDATVLSARSATEVQLSKPKMVPSSPTKVNE